MDYRDIQKLIAFFSALKDSGFKQDLKQIPSSVMINGQRTPVDKSYCLSLLRRFPQFQGDKFKDDNALLKYLSDPNNRKFLLGNFTRTQQVELTQVLEEKPVVEETSGEQPGGQEASSRQTMGEPAGTMAGGVPFPAASSGATAARAPQRVIRVVRQTPEPETTTSAPSAQSGSATVTSSRGFTPTGSTSISSSTTFSSGGINIKIDSLPNVAKNFGSNAQIFAKKNLGRLGRGIAGPGLTGAYNLLGKAAGGGLNAFERLSNPGLKGTSRSFVSSGSKKLVWGLLLGFFFFAIFTGLIGGLSGTTPPTGAAPGGGIPTVSLASCPVSSSKITWPSYQINPLTSIPTGHCTTDDEGKCPTDCPFTGRRAKSIDIDTSGGKNVILPAINGQSVQWKFIQPLCAGAGTYPNCSAANGGTGGLYTFEGTVLGQTDKWYLQLVHMTVPSQLILNQTYTSGTIAGKTDISIVHVTMGKNIINPLGSGTTDTDCDPGWIPADTGVGMCTGLPPAQTLENTYWFLLNRQKRYEILYKGTPEKISQSQVVKISTINPGSPGNEPTPIPQKLGRKFWSLTGEVRPHPQDSDPTGYEKFGPYFIVLDVPFKNQPDPSCNNKGTTDCYGPVPYKECGPNQDQQCNWHTEGEFGIHGNDKLDPPGSAGCVRHANTDIIEIYNTLSSAKAVNSNTRYYVIDSDIDSQGLTDEKFAQELNK